MIVILIMIVVMVMITMMTMMGLSRGYWCKVRMSSAWRFHVFSVILYPDQDARDPDPFGVVVERILTQKHRFGYTTLRSRQFRPHVL